MTMQLDMFAAPDRDIDITRNFHGGNAESIAAKELSRHRAGVDRMRILALARSRGARGITCDEAEQVLGLPHQTCSARFSELKRDGMLVPTELTRETRRRSPARVMIVSTSQGNAACPASP